MFRVRFNESHTEGYRPAQDADRVREQLARMLKRQRLVLSHTDDAGFACFVPKAVTPKRRSRKICPRCGYQV